MTTRLLRAVLGGAFALGLVATTVPAVSAAPVRPTAIVGASVPAAIPLVYGEQNKHVKRVQRILGVKRTGYYGPLTRKAVKKFQRSSSLRVTGNVNARTWLALLRLEARQRAPRRRRSTRP
jgi:peptidoglycan hydrolase-like protein with peptidoglycan-binding domain